MTYSDDIAGRGYTVGWAVTFDGIDDILVSHDGITISGKSGTAYTVIIGTPSGGGEQLDRARSIVTPGGFSVDVFATDAIVALFARRGGTEDALDTSGALSASGTDISLRSGNATYSAGDVVHIDREAIVLTTDAGGGDYENCIRGALGSQAKPHGAGAIISNKPRYWLGRRAQLHVVMLETGNSKAVRTAILADSPRFQNGVFGLSFVDMMTEVNRPIATGWGTTPVTPRTPEFASTGVFGYVTADVGDARQFASGGTTHIRIDWPDGFAVYKLFGDVSHAGNTVQLRRSQLIAWDADDGRNHGDLLGEGLEDLPEMVGRSVAVIHGDPVDIALQVLLSDVGDGANHATYDVLPGVSVANATTTADLTPKRWGAGLPGSWINIDSWEAARGLGGLITVYLEEQTTLLDFLVNEIAWRLGGFVYVDADGKIAFQQYKDASEPVDFSLTRDDVLMAVVNVSDDETEVIGTAEIECNYDPRSRTFRHKIGATWVPTFELYGSGKNSISVKSKSLQIGTPGTFQSLVSPPISELDVVARLDGKYARTRNGLNTVSLSLPWSQSEKAIVGALFALTDDRMPDGDGGVGITGRKHEIVSADPDYSQMVVTVRAEQTPPGFVVAPAFVVASWDLGTLILTIDEVGDETDLWDADPGLDFAAGFSVRLYDNSDNFQTHELLTIASVTSSTIVLDLAPSTITVPGAGDIIVFEFDVPSPSVPSTPGYLYDAHLILGDDATYPPTVSNAAGGNSRNAMVWG